MTERDPILEPFETLTGSWTTKASHPLLDNIVPGSVTFVARAPGDWQDDLAVTYHRQAAEQVTGG